VNVLAILTLVLSAADHWTTYLCLRDPVSGWVITEANPLADWLFGAIGLVPGLLVDSGLTVLAVCFLLTTSHIPKAFKIGFFGLIVTSTGFAVVNNVYAISSIGLSPFGIG
jgi:hypothetical protein